MILLLMILASADPSGAWQDNDGNQLFIARGVEGDFTTLWIDAEDKSLVYIGEARRLHVVKGELGKDAQALLTLTDYADMSAVLHQYSGNFFVRTTFVYNPFTPDRLYTAAPKVRWFRFVRQ
jgi:hypothetical protein